MIKGEELKIRELTNYSNERGGASVQFTAELLKEKPNLLVLIGLEEQVIQFTGDCNRAKINIDYILEDHTTGFIKTEIKSGFRIPSFLKTTFTPILDVSDVVLTTLLISVEKDEDVAKVKKLSKNSTLFGIDLKNTIKNEIDENTDSEQNSDENEKSNLILTGSQLFKIDSIIAASKINYLSIYSLYHLLKKLG